MIIIQMGIFFLVIGILSIIIYRCFSLIVLLLMILFFTDYHYKFIQCSLCKHQLITFSPKHIGNFIVNMEKNLQNLFKQKK
jgi:hypothetical protein